MKSTVGLAAAIAAIFLGAAVTHASGPIAVYALVDKVTLEPSAGAPERIQIWGVFITAQDQGGGAYKPAERGYLYYKLPERAADVASREWNDLKSVAGTRQVVGMGSSWMMSGRVRKADEKPDAPDSYTMGNGLVRVNSDNPRAKELLDYKEHQ